MLRLAEQELAKAPSGLTVYELRQALRRRSLQVSVEMLTFVLQEEGRPRIEQVSERPERYAVRMVPWQPTAPTTLEPWERRRQDLVLQLSDPALEVLRLQVPVGDQALRARLDVVAEGTPTVWFSMRVSGPVLLNLLAGTGPRTLSPGWRLPLRALPTHGLAPPVLLVWSASDPRAAADQVVSLLRGTLGVQADRVRLDAEVCTPAEAERRADGYRAVRQARARRSSGGFAQATCLKCGQPLTHPESLRVGVGPECRRYYGPEYFRAMASAPTQDRLWFGAKEPREWLRQVIGDLKPQGSWTGTGEPKDA